jgi:hypothetical protein
MTEEHEIVSIDTPLETVRDIFNYFHEAANVVQLQVANDKTRYAWQNMSGFQYTMQILHDSPDHSPGTLVAPRRCWLADNTATE